MTFSEAFEKVYQARTGTGWESLQKSVVPVGSLVDGTGRLCCDAATKVLDLSPLAPVCAESRFVPSSLFVRDEMKDMFDKLVSPHGQGVRKRILTGSPGIGKSVLFFLAALRRAILHEEKVMYMRKTTQDEGKISVFIMEKTEGIGNSVNVLFSDELETRENPNLTVLYLSLRNASQLKSKDYYGMLDGPAHDSKDPDLLHHGYQALCTSGGHPARKQDQIRSLSILVLSAWSQDTIVTAMIQLMDLDRDAAIRKYEIIGGRIRLAFLTDDDAKDWYREQLTVCGTETIKLAITNGGSAGCMKSSDRLRSRFFDAETVTNRMIVDSRFLFNSLSQQISLTDLLDPYDMSKALGLSAARGWFYKEILHRAFQVFKNDSTTLIKDWKKFPGTGAQGAAAFAQACENGEQGLYWVPSIPNFANIDAAVLLGSTLVCYQFTVQETHGFDESTFWSDFVNIVVIKGVPIKDVFVIFVTPQDVQFNLTHPDYKQDYSVSQGPHSRKQPLPEMQIHFSHFFVDPRQAKEQLYDETEKLLPKDVQDMQVE
eukprot:CAMPEP_0168741098 /NCGR_PEP_ID=MMETSP0724-20121128/12327_1 /TAXON_ID=265536 /ORGANISM="Amphiprora sp., Strain CCMP467" /LENGTH=541 /DNA_ID=CAMNT_0008788569 /DNA_START=55 /DNA_END=1680 /DNA_ORIENTATION=-